MISLQSNENPKTNGEVPGSSTASCSSACPHLHVHMGSTYSPSKRESRRVDVEGVGGHREVNMNFTVYTYELNFSKN